MIALTLLGQPPARCVRRELLDAQLAQCAQAILQMVGLGDPAVANCLYVDCHDPEALAGMGSAEQRAGWSTGDLAADSAGRRRGRWLRARSNR